MILRALTGLIVGLIYAALAGAFTFLFWRLTNDPAYPGPMIPDNNAWGRIVIFFMTVTAAVLGIPVATLVSLTRLNMTRAALIGGAIGMVLFLLLLFDLVKGVPKTRVYWTELFQGLGMFFVLFPTGLALTAMAASLVVRKLKL
jgi:hypothetical protein